MLPFTVPSRDQLTPDAQAIYAQFVQAMGKMPNLYATIGYSANALATYTQYVRGQAKNTFHARDREGIYLIVSQINGCEYCLASHTASAIKAGWKEEDTLALRAGTYADAKWKVLYAIIRSVLDNRGEIPDTLLRDFSALGFGDAAIMDLLVLINVMSFTNYAFRLVKIPIDFPLAKPV